MMKSIEKKSLELLSKAAMKTAVKEINSACLLFGYQPKMPDAAKKLKRKK
ncbi:MAG: cyclic lactone autoinducer peptide [Lachnospiraceae bacterium]